MKTTKCEFYKKPCKRVYVHLSYCGPECLAAHYSVARLLVTDNRWRRRAKIVSFDLRRVDRVR